MRTWSTGLCAGIIASVWLWPHGTYLVAVAAAALAMLAAHRRYRLAVAVLAGAVWGGWTHEQALEHRWPACLHGADVHLEGAVLGLPTVAHGIARLNVATERLVVDGEGCEHRPPRRVRLSWYDREAIAPGGRFVGQVRLRTPHSFANPAGFDYETWLLGEGIDATGYVREGRIEPGRGFDRQRLRASLGDFVRRHGGEQAGLLTALLNGDGSGIDDDDWFVFRESGAVHVLVVSGLHVALAAGFGFLVGSLLARMLRPRIATRPVALAAALVLMLAYAAVAGASTPVVRAVLMALIGMGAAAVGRSVGALDVWLTALAVVLVTDPLAVLDRGAWLSFGAVAILLAFFVPRRPRSTMFAALVQAQLVVTVAQLGLVAVAVGQLQPTAALVNLVVIPVTTLLVIPLVFLALPLALVGFAAAPLALAAAIMEIVVDGLEVWVGWFPSISAGVLGVGMVLAALLLLAAALPLAWRHRAVLAAVALALLMPEFDRVPEGEYRITALDVGQGTAVLVDTHAHRLLYDAGPRYPSGFDLGAAVVVPAVRATGAARLDVLVLSHGDMDHIGGAATVRERLDVAREYGNGTTAGTVLKCRAGIEWRWDGVTFRMLAPRSAWTVAADNERSCVLAIDNGTARALLPGDIGRVTEWRLLAVLEHSDWLLVPHHGSGGSSSQRFVCRVRPRVAVVSAGYRNRFGHPHPSVVSRYRRAGSRVLATARHGALVWTSARPGVVAAWRDGRGPRRMAPVPLKVPAPRACESCAADAEAGRPCRHR